MLSLPLRPLNFNAFNRTRQKQQEKESVVDAPSVLEVKGRKVKAEPDESQSSRQGGRETRLRTKDSAQDFPSGAADSKSAPDRCRLLSSD